MENTSGLLFPMAGSVVYSRSLMGASGLITELGGNIERVCCESGLSISDIDSDGVQLTIKQVASFFTLSAIECQTNDFGLRLSTFQDMSVLGPTWELIRGATTIREMLLDLSRYFFLHTLGAIVKLEQLDESVIFSFNLPKSKLIDDQQTVELALGVLCAELRRHALPDWQPREVRLRYSTPDDLTWYHQILGPNIRFNQDNNSLALDADILDCPIIITSNQPQFQSSQPISLLVEKTIRFLLPMTECSLDQVASALSLSKRTLQRRLGDANISFSTIRDQVRADLALNYLRQSKFNCSEVSEILGYADSSGLSRSFRRWHGVSPSQVTSDVNNCRN